MKRSPPWKVESTRQSAEPILGISPCAEQLRRKATALAGVPGNLMIAGEPGTGKRFLAYRIHEHSSGSARAPFVEISPRTTEGELRVILFEEDRRKQEGILGHAVAHLSHGSTLFIRNVAECGFLAQSRIARFLIQHERPAYRGARPVRVIFSNPDSWEKIIPARRLNDSLNVYCRRYEQLSIQPLRNRRNDIPLFIDYFLRTMTGGRPPGVDSELMTELTGLPYYDNVRELRSLLAEALLVTRENMLVLPGFVLDEPAAVRSLLESILGGRKSDLEGAIHGLQKALIRRALLRCDQDRACAAALLGLTDINLRYRLRKFNLSGTPGGGGSNRPGPKKIRVR